MAKGDTQRIRDVLINLTIDGKTVTNAQIAAALDMVFNTEKQTLYRTLRDFIKSGEIEKASKGVYKYRGKAGKPQLQQIMLRALRARKTVTIDDLMEFSRASREYTKNWMRMLVKREIVRRIRTGNKWKYQLVNDPVIMPFNEEKAEKRKIRRQKKREALAALDAAEKAIRKAREIIKTETVNREP